MNHRFLPSALAASLLVMGASPALCSAADGPDPIELMRESAAAAAATPAVAADLSARVHVVMGDQENDQTTHYQFLRRGDSEFSFRETAEDGAPGDAGIAVFVAGGVTMTHLAPMRRFSLEESEEGSDPFAEFVQGRLARGVANGLGNLALSFLSPAAMQQLAERVTASEYVGEEKLGETPALRCRYAVDNEMKFDVWYDATPGKPLALRLVPDLTELAKESPAAKRHANFLYEIEFEYRGWDAAPELTDEDFRPERPEGSRFVESFFSRPPEEPNPLLKSEAPSFELDGLDGKKVNLADHLGKDVVLLDFWATWCPPCVEALPKIDRVAKTFADRGVVFFAVDQGESVEEVEAFLDKKDLAPPVLMDAEGAVATAFGVEGLPTSVLIGKDGTVQVVHVGLSRDLEDRLTGELEALVGGQDLAAEAIAKFRAEQAKADAKAERLWARFRGEGN